VLVKDHLFILFRLNEEKIRRKKDPDFLQEMGSFSYSHPRPLFFAMDSRKGSENKKLNPGPTLEMSILKKEKEFKWISCPGSSFHPIREQGAACRRIMANGTGVR